MKKYIVLGVSNFLSSIFDVIHAQGGKVSKIYQNVPELKEKSGYTSQRRIGLLEYPVEFFDTMKSFTKEEGYEYVLGFITVHKYRFINELKEKYEINLASLIHPTSYIGSNVHIGEGVYIMPRAVIDCNVILDDFCTINKAAVVGHEARIGKYSLIGPSATIAGSTVVGDNCFIGMNAAVIDKLTIGDWTIVGAGSVVTRDIKPEVVAVGTPARVIKKNEMRDFHRYISKRFNGLQSDVFQKV